MTLMNDSGLVPEFTQGDRFRKARELTGLGQREFAVEIGVSQQTVTNAEKGHTKVRKITTNAWAMRTGVSRRWLETGQAPSGHDDGGSTLRSSEHPTTEEYVGARVLDFVGRAA